MRKQVTPKKTRGPSVDTSWHEAFLAALRNSGNVRAACQSAKVTRKCAYEQRDKDAEFASAWGEAMEDATDALEAMARQRAAKSSDTLLIFLLKAHRPEKFRDRLDVNLSKLSDEQLLAIVEARGPGGTGATGSGDTTE